MAHQFVVVGAGIAGLATAAALQRRDHAVAVIEEREDTSPGAGISIWPNALAALDRLGLGDAVRAAGGQVSAGALRWHDGTWLRRPSHDRIVTALGEALVVVQRAALRDILLGALSPGTVRYGTAVTSLVQDGNAVRVSLADGSAVSADAVVGADGTRSVVARHLNGALPNRYAGYTAWRGVAEHALDPTLASEGFAPGVEVGYVPLGPDRTYWFATERLPEGHRSPGGELAYLQSRLARWAEPLPTILASTDAGQVLRNDLYDRATAPRWARGPVVIVGDAAHPMRPHLGQGGCQGIEDAAILAELVEHGPDLTTAFTRFATFRRRRVRAMVRQSKTIGRVVNLRPAVLSSAALHASMVIPESVIAHHLGGLASRSAFVLPHRQA